LALDEWRRIRGEQEIITRFEPERAMTALSTLLSGPEDRRRFLTLLDRLLGDERVQPDQATPQQRAALARIHEVLGDGAKGRAPVQRAAGQEKEPTGAIMNTFSNTTFDKIRVDRREWCRTFSRSDIESLARVRRSDAYDVNGGMDARWH
jgi:hypothetical protein